MHLTALFFFIIINFVCNNFGIGSGISRFGAAKTMSMIKILKCIKKIVFTDYLLTICCFSHFYGHKLLKFDFEGFISKFDFDKSLLNLINFYNLLFITL